MADHAVPDKAIPERTSSLVATTSTKEEDLALDFDRLGLDLTVKDAREDKNASSHASESVLTTSAAAASLPPIPSSPDTGLAESISQTADHISEQYEPSSKVLPTSTCTRNPGQASDSSTTVNVTTAAPVVHETIKVQHHEIIKKVVHKEVHEYHEYTRILPVIETKLLPARHFMKTEDGRKIECALSDIPVGDTTSTITYHPSGDSAPAKLSPSDFGSLSNVTTVKPR